MQCAHWALHDVLVYLSTHAESVVLLADDAHRFSLPQMCRLRGDVLREFVRRFEDSLERCCTYDDQGTDGAAFARPKTNQHTLGGELEEGKMTQKVLDLGRINS